MIQLVNQDNMIVAGAVVAMAIFYVLWRCNFNNQNKHKLQEQQVILVTGASSGIGRSVALALIQQGHVVYGAARRDMKDLEEAGGHSIHLDVTREEHIVRAVERIVKEQGRLDVLVNNAGIAVYGPVEETSLMDARKQFDVNVFGVARMIQEVLPIMRQQESKGTIINMSSVAAHGRLPFASLYVSTKAALEKFTDCLRIEMNPSGIRVVIVQPGFVKSELEDLMLSAMMERSKNTLYERTVGNFNKKMRGLFSQCAAPPSVIADLIKDIVMDPRPKARYSAGGMASLTLFMGHWLPDNIHDGLALDFLKE